MSNQEVDPTAIRVLLTGFGVCLSFPISPITL